MKENRKIDAPPHARACGLNGARFLDDRSFEHTLKGVVCERNYRHRKKGQEEIVGFVLIVVLIAVVFVIFLGIKLRNSEPTQKESEIIYQFLESSMEQTTDCVLRPNGKNLVMNELIKECHFTDNTCISTKSSCETSKDTMKGILEATWKVGEEYPYKGYELNVNYDYNSSSGEKNEEIFSIIEGNCNNTYIGNSYWISAFPGSIILEAKLCS